LEKIPSRFTSGIDKIPYRPLRWITYAIDYQFTGLNPTGYHISNIAFHALTTFLIYLTILTLVENRRIAFFAALIFAVHPVHTDSVAYISGRRDILSTLFYILGFYIFLESRKKKKSKFLVLSLAAYLLAIASKEMAVTLPAIFFIYDLIRSLPDEGSLTNRLFNALKKVISSYKFFYLAFLTPAILFTCYKVLIKSPSNKAGLYGGSLYIQLLTVGKILVYYIKLLFFPINLIADYSFNSFPLPQTLFEAETLLSLVVLFAIAFLTLKLLCKNKIMAFSLIWFFITLLPVCHIFPHHELLAEHYLYLPSFGFVLLIALVLELLLTSTKYKHHIYTVFILVILLFSVRTFYRNYDWKNSFTIWQKTVKTVPHCVRAINNLGVEYFKRKDLKQAKALHQKALEIQPVYEKAYYNLGNAYRTEQNFDRAIEMYKKAVQLNPKNFRAYNNLGNAYAIQKRYDQAMKEYKSVLKLKPRYAEAHNNLGNVYRSLGKTDLAIAHYKRAIKIKSRYFDAYSNLANTYADLKQYEKSIETLKKAIGKNPFIPSTYNHLGRIYTKTGQYGKAIEMYEYAIKLKPNYPEAHNNLGMAYEKKNSYQQAIKHFKRAIEIKPAFPKPYLNLGNLYLGKLNDKRNALLYLKKWLKMAPNHPDSDSIRKKIDRIKKGSIG
jgi:tetratricopeptide (TPR) repeat protein